MAFDNILGVGRTPRFNPVQATYLIDNAFNLSPGASPAPETSTTTISNDGVQRTYAVSVSVAPMSNGGGHVATNPALVVYLNDKLIARYSLPRVADVDDTGGDWKIDDTIPFMYDLIGANNTLSATVSADNGDVNGYDVRAKITLFAINI